MTLPLSGHGGRLLRAPAATPTTFTEIAEVGDITLPGLDHNEFDGTSHNRNIDAYVLGVLRRDLFTIRIFILPTDPTHDHLTGLIKACTTNPVPTDGWKMIFPDTVTTWVGSGQCKSVSNIVMPVDGLMSADVGVRLSDKMTINGVIIG